MVFYFAWVADGNTTFGVEHHVEDEKIAAFTVTHQENEIPAASIDIRNPRVGLLNDDREQWAWLGWRKPDNSVVPLFHGRLIGIPDGIDGNIIRLSFLGKPADYEEQKATLAETLRTDPYWDPIWINQDRLSDPDSVLEARPQLWHVGRTDKTLTVSHIINGEDGTVLFDETDVMADSLDVKIGNEPIRRVAVEATVSWQQFAKGNVDLAGKLIEEFHTAGSSSGVTSFTGQGLESTWPLPFDNIGGGWSVAEASVLLLSGDAVTAEFVEVTIGTSGGPPPDETTGGSNAARFYLWEFWPTLVVTYEAARSRSEVLSFELSADVQDVLTDSEPKVFDIKISSNAVAVEVDGLEGTFASTFVGGVTSGVSIPIGDIRRKSYFNIDRGKRSLRWLLALARTKLMYSARCVQVSFDISFARAVELSCRVDATVTDPHLPGGEANGKVIGYSFSLDGEKGDLLGQVSIACSIGKGNALSLDDGDPSYVEDGYADEGWQYLLGAQLDLGTGDVAYEDYAIDVDDDGIDFFNMTPGNVIDELNVFNGENVQRPILESEYPDIQSAINALNEVFTRVELTLKPVKTGPFVTQFPIVVTALALAKTIDLEAAA